MPSSSDTSPIDTPSRPSSLYLDCPSQQSSAHDEKQQLQIQQHHKLRTSPICSPHRSSEGNYNRSSSNGSQHSNTHQRRIRPIDSELPQQQSSSSRVAAAPDSPSYTRISPSSRLAYTSLFLLFVAFAITHAVFHGFESMHDARHADLNNVAQDVTVEDEVVPPLNNGVKYDNRSTNEKREGGASVSNTESTEPTATVLSRISQLSYLISNLGAGDVVECYVVTRMAPLTNVVSSVPLGNANADSPGNNRNLEADNDGNDSKQQEVISATASNQPAAPILIRKSGLAFRYRPRVASALSNNNSPDAPPNAPKYFEITLEYGPQRTGKSKSFESLPMLHVDTDAGEQTNKYISWENEGRVYHSTHISNEWTEAYYMAPITGVVLEKILQRAVDYPRKRPRYQPFEVISMPSRNLIVRSSGSDDFVWEMFRDLADLYVEIDPILIPPRGTVQFYVADAVSSQSTKEDEMPPSTSRREPNPNVQRVKGGSHEGHASKFYERFYACATAIKTGDYSLYSPPVTDEPTSAPSEYTTAFPSQAPTELKVDVATTKSDNIPNHRTKNSTLNASVIEDNEGINHVENLSNNATLVVDGDNETHRVLEDSNGDVTKVDAQSFEINNSNSTLDELNNSTLESDEEKDAEQLQQAAVEAAEAAAEMASKNSSLADSAAAASQAAEAAKKAADATTAARNKVAAEGIISGDGALATSILSTCFSDPKYGILQTNKVKKTRADEDDTEKRDEMIVNDESGNGEESDEEVELRESVFAYIYLDGETFFRLNLTSPFWGTANYLQTVPQPNLKPEGWGDSVDWTIFMFILVGALFGFLVMCHQGGCLSVDKRLQFRWFFRPTDHDNVDWDDGLYSSEAEKDALRHGGGFAHTIGIDAIPTSMGGKLYLDRSLDSAGSGSSTTDEGSTAMLLEMAHRRAASTGLAPGKGDTLPSSLRVRRDNPDQVQRPTLATTSKPAMPRQSPAASPRNDDDAGDGFIRNINGIALPLT